jgi:drug/metabolite transporter (DMT)-like permease
VSTPPGTAGGASAAASGGLSLRAFGALLLIALIMGANHVAARRAFDDGLDVATAVACRSGVTALVLLMLLRWQGLPVWPRVAPAGAGSAPPPRLKRWALPAIALVIAVQSFCLYASVARLPVALALLAFNSYPLATAFWEWLLYRHMPSRTMLLAMPVILAGLALALDVLGAASGLGAAAQWSRIGAGVAFALGASASFGLALALTQHETQGVDGRARSFATMAQVGVLAALAVALGGGPHWPQSAAGWAGLAALTVLYGTGITMLFTLLPRLGVGRYAAVMNVEPIFALVLAWALLAQAVAPMQVVGGLVVVAAVMGLGLRGR